MAFSNMRIFQKLFLIFAATAALSALAMAVVLGFSLQSGFTDYLNARDREQLNDFIQSAERKLAEQTHVTSGPVDINMLVADLTHAGLIPEAAPRFRLRHPDEFRGPPRDSKQRRRPPIAFAARLMLFDVNHRQVLGPPLPPDPRAQALVIERPIRLDQRVVAYARVLPRGPDPQNVEARFLRSQYTNAAIVSALLIAGAALIAFWLARHGVGQLVAVQRAAAAIAKGDFAVRVPVSGNDELADVAHDINRMAESLETLEGARRRWLAEIGHELRTPLAVLLGELDAMRDGVRKIDQAGIASLWEEAQRLNMLVEDLHFLAMSDLSAQPFTWLAIDAAELLRSLQARFAPIAGNAGLELALGDTKPIEVTWDPLRVEQLLANLLVNSIRYTDSPGRIAISVAQSGRELSIVIDDTKPGVPDDQLTHLFEPLFRLEESRDRVSGGSGLGLSVSAAIARAHGGTITAQASPLGGLRMTVRLPMVAKGAHA